MSKNSSAKYYQDNEKKLQKKLEKDIKVFLQNKKKKSNKMFMQDTKMPQNMKSKYYSSIEKIYNDQDI